MEIYIFTNAASTFLILIFKPRINFIIDIVDIFANYYYEYYEFSITNESLQNYLIQLDNEVSIDNFACQLYILALSLKYFRTSPVTNTFF